MPPEENQTETTTIPIQTVDEPQTQTIATTEADTTNYSELQLSQLELMTNRLEMILLLNVFLIVVFLYYVMRGMKKK
jgi:hypothetical protein